MPECYIRGSTIKYLRIPDEIIDMVKEEVVSKGRGRGGMQQQKQQKGRGVGGAGRGNGPAWFSAWRGGERDPALKFHPLCKEQLLLLSLNPGLCVWAKPEPLPWESERVAASAREQKGFVPAMCLPPYWGWAGAQESLNLTVSPLPRLGGERGPTEPVSVG